jgi:ATP-binding cassette, subfamily B, bacterial MsbA
MRDYLRKVLELTRPYRGRFALGLLCGFLSGALAFTLPVSLKLAVDVVFPPETVASALVQKGAAGVDANQGVAQNQAVNGTTSKPATKLIPFQLPAPIKRRLDGLVNWFRPPGHASSARLVFVIALIPAAMFLRNALAYLNTYLLHWVGIRAANDLRVRLFKHLVDMPLGFFSSTSTGDLMTRIEGANAVNTTITGAIGTLIREPVSIVVLIGYLLGQESVLTLFTLLVFPICLIPIVIFGRKSRKSDRGFHTTYANLTGVTHESLTGIRVIKAYNLESLVVGEFRKAINGVTSFLMRSIRAGELPGPLIEFIGSIGVALVFCYFAFGSTGRAPASSGDLLTFFIAVFGLYAPVKNLSRLHHQLSLARATVEPAYQLLAMQSTLPEPADPKPLKAHGAPIRFADVSFSYGEKPVLQKINLTIRPGQLVALVGRTGSGKTSLANLLLRFYDPQNGAIFVGDTDIRAVSSRELRANIAVVAQETILFNDTIRHNIALGRPGASDAEVEEAAKHAYAHEFIMEKPRGYESMVGEKGVNLSGGQRQRIAIARALLRNAPILVLDEATSALDTESERIVQRALEELMQGRTTICIAHRLSTIQKADLIVVLDGGRIIETGTHDQLLKAGGLYSKLYELQFGENGES